MSHFPDLLNIDQDNTGENFWPSLTDIMMVVVMIFLISTATLIIKNWSLVQDLTTTIEKERAARQKIQLTAAENMTLEERVAALEEMLSDFQLREMRSREDKAALEKRVSALLAKLSQSTRFVATLKAKLTDKTNQIKTQLAQLERIESELKAAREETQTRQQTLQSLQTQLQQQTSQLDDKTRELASANEIITSLRLKQENQQAALDSSRQTMTLTEENLEKLREQFAELEQKYNKLVRPARTTKGKTIVSVRLQKVDDESRYAIKLPDSHNFVTVDKSTLHAQLAALKQQYGDKLYVRIVFPDNNGLSYKEAYSFTNEILTKYDYYHAEQP